MRPEGMHPKAWEAWIQSGVPASRIGQTVGNAPASAGTHGADGTFLGEHGSKRPYTAAVDVRIKDLDDDQVWALLGQLSQRGFAAFYRKPGFDGWPATEVRHVHAVFAGVPMKEALKRQVRDYLEDPPKDGLAHHHDYGFFKPSQYARGVIDSLFKAANP